MLELIFIILTLISTRLMLKVIPGRTAKMPLHFNIKEEEEIIASIRNNPYNIPGMEIIKSNMFSLPLHQKIWLTAQETMKESGQRELPESIIGWVEDNYNPSKSYKEFLKDITFNEEILAKDQYILVEKENYTLKMINENDKIIFEYDNWKEICIKFEEKFQQKLQDTGLRESFEEIVKNNPRIIMERNSYESNINNLASNLINNFEDRTSYNGLNQIVETDDPKTPIKRLPSMLSRKFTLLTYVIAIGGAISIINFTDNWLSRISLLILLLFSLEWSIVDIMTMYLDDIAFYIGVSLSWLTAVLALWKEDNLVQIIPAIGFTLVMVLLFEGLNKYFRYRRGVDGIGFGDTLIIIGTVGVPTAIGGAWVLGYRIVMLSFFLGIFGFFVMKVKSKHGKNQPFAFGPYLAIGWLLGILSWVLTNGITSLAF